MTGPKGRPLSLARLRAVPAGGRVLDRAGDSWTRGVAYWRHSRTGQDATSAALHREHRPLFHVPPPAS